MANGPVPSTLPTPIPNGIGSRPGAPYDPLPLRRFHLYNIRGLKTKTQNKVPTISDIAHDPIQPASMIALTETWLQDHLDAEISIPDFQPPFREDRKRKRAKRGRASGGVAVYVHEDLAAENVFSFNSGVIECIGVMVESLNLMTYTVYRQPDEPDHRSTWQHFSAFLAKLNEHLDSLPTPTPDIIVQGDLNLPHANWETGECGPAAGTSKVTRDEKKMVKALYELSLNHFLVQQVEGPTHKLGNTLDLIFSNNASLTHNIDITPSASRISDHHQITMDVTYKQATDTEATESQDNSDTQADMWRKLNFQSPDVDWTALADDLQSHNWNQEFRHKDTMGMHEAFMEACLTISQLHVPDRKTQQKKASHVPRHRARLMHNRARILKSINTCTKQSQKMKMQSRLTEIETALRSSREQQSSADEEKAVASIKKNPKFFFSYANKHSKVRSGIGPLRTPDKTLTKSAPKMAEILAEQYNSAFSQPRHRDGDPQALFPESPSQLPSRDKLENIAFTDDELAEAMRELRANAAAGPDGYPAILLRNCSQALAPPLARIWRQSLTEGVIPPSCKEALIVPIHKGKSKAVPKNYRPVALTSQLSKVFEKVVRKHMVSFMDEKQLLNPSQHGFRAGLSCLSQLLAHYDTVTAHLEEGRGVDVVYLDFAKAFDKVDIGITLRKLHQLGVRGRLGRWLVSFLTEMFQTVVVSQAKSSPQPVISGVPQGSVLGPLLFLILLGNIDEDVVDAFISSFADDTRVGLPISGASDNCLLQQDLCRIYDWAKESNMEFNSEKFEMLCYQAHPKQPRPPQTLVSDIGTPIEEKDHLRDLGVTLSNDATFSQHIAERVSVVKKLTGWALRTFKSRATHLMLTIWKSLILCHIDYCSQLWSPYKAGEIQAIESLQKAFISKIASMHEFNYWQQLKMLKLYSLERRRERYSIIYTWRTLESQVPNLSSTPIEAKWHPRRGRECKIPTLANSVHPTIKAIRFGSFAYRGPRLFNCLPADLRNLSKCSVDTFKNALDKFLGSIPDEPLIPGLTSLRQIETNSLVDWIAHVAREGLPVEPGRDAAGLQRS